MNVMPQTKPLILRPDEVRGLLDGSRTMIARVMKVQPDAVSKRGIPYLFDRDERGEVIKHPEHDHWAKIKKELTSPFGAPGTRLLGKEQYGIFYEESIGGKYRASINYIADDSHRIVDVPDDAEYTIRYKISAICMPPWASRLTLVTEEVKAVRVQEVDNLQAHAMGFKLAHWKRDRRIGMYTNDDLDMAIKSFRNDWNTNNQRHPYESNPWIWLAKVMVAE